MWDSNFTDEVFVAVKRFNLSWTEVQKIAHNSYEFSFTDESTKRKLISNYKSDLKIFANQFSNTNWENVLAKVPAITHGYGRSTLGLKL